MKKLLLATALGSSAATFAVMQSATSAAKLENARVVVREVTSPPGGVRPAGVRTADQVIVFLDDCRYRRTDPRTGEKTVRTRKSGDVIWHSKGEDAPELMNLGDKPYRTIVIELK